MTQSAIKDHHQVLIVGAGAGGLTVAARLAKAVKGADIAVLDPSDKHYYQPYWTLVGGGIAKKEVTERNQADLIPNGVKWHRDAVTEFLPEENAVLTASGRRIGYDYLVVSPGIQLNWDAIPGLKENIGSNGLCSNYSYETVDSTWESIRNFQGGNAIFTHPATPIKCGGAPQKIMYLAADYWRKNPPAKDYKIIFSIATPKIFAIDQYAASLLKVIDHYGIDMRLQHNLTSIDAEAKSAGFRNLATEEDETIPYSMMHVTPPMSAPDFVKSSSLVDAGGWVDVDKHTLQHKKYANIFGLGDASNIPTSKTGAAIRKQAPTVVTNLVAAMNGQALNGSYDGYTSCPIVTAYGKLIMAEFDYDGNSKETFPFDQTKERLSMYLVKKHLLPTLYWSGMLKGRA